MYSRSSFGSYYPVNSIIHKLNPIIKLVNFIITIIVLILTNSLYIHIFLLVYVLLMACMSMVPIKYYFNTFWFFRYIYIIVGIIMALSGKSMELYFVYMSKLIIFFEYLNILAFTTSPSENIYALDRFLSLPNFLYLNVSSIAFKINSLLRYFPLYMTTKYKTITSSISRGIVYGKLSFIKKIKLHFNIRRLARIKNREMLNESKLRLFDIKSKRTNYRTNKVTFNDIFFLAFHVLMIIVYLIEGGIL